MFLLRSKPKRFPRATFIALAFTCVLAGLLVPMRGAEAILYFYVSTTDAKNS